MTPLNTSEIVAQIASLAITELPKVLAAISDALSSKSAALAAANAAIQAGEIASDVAEDIKFPAT
jgi:hypothetical protein